MHFIDSLFFFVQQVAVMLPGALRADAMAELGLGMLLDVFFELHPIAPRILIYPDFFAVTANRKDAFQDIDFAGQFLHLPGIFVNKIRKD